ncbi:MAG: helix-turn-helix domain-containing protein [Streptosporangiaceae bacterium]
MIYATIRPTQKSEVTVTPRVWFGEELRRAREAAGFRSQQAFADKIGFERTVVSKAESGHRVPSPEVLSAWCEVCHLDKELYRRMAELARSADGPVPEWFEKWLEAESEAQMLRYWQPTIIPAILQTPDYSRVLLASFDPDRADEMTAAKMERKLIFDRPEQPDIVVVLDEMVLRRPMGSPGIMHEQLLYVAEMSRRSFIGIQVVPAGTGTNAGLSGPLNLASIDGKPGVVYMDALKGMTTENPLLVREATVTFDRVLGDALPRGASRDLILKVDDELWTQTG